MINGYIVRISVVFCKNQIWRLADGGQAVFSAEQAFSGCLHLKSRPLLKQKEPTQHILLYHAGCVYASPSADTGGVLLIRQPFKFFHPMRFLAFTNTADLPPSCKAGRKIQFCPASQTGSRSLRDALVGHTNRHKNRNDQRQRKQIRPTRSAGGSNCFLPSYFTPFGYPVRNGTLAFYPAGCR